MNKDRLVYRWNGSELNWEEIEFLELDTGDIFRMFEGEDNRQVTDEFGLTVFIVTGPVEYNEEAKSPSVQAAALERWAYNLPINIEAPVKDEQ